MTDQQSRDNDPFDAVFGGDQRPDGSPPAQPISRRQAREQAQARAERERADAHGVPESPSGGSPAAKGEATGGAGANNPETNDAETNGPDAADLIVGRLGFDAADAESGSAARTERRRHEQAAYPQREKRSKRGLIVALVSLVTVAVVAAGVFYVWTTFEPQIRAVMGWEEPNDYEGSGTGEVLVSIDEGDTGTDIAETLHAAGVTKTFDAFYDLLLAQSTEPVFHPGVYRLAEGMSAQAALDALLNPENREERTALIREGITGAQILEELSTATEIPVEEFEAAIADPTQYGVPESAPSIEGWLFPAQYTFAPGVTATEVIQTLVDRTVQSLDAAEVPEADRERILTIASIIQREARQADDFYRVSRVIQNRLEIDMMLQMDSTSQYGVNASTESVWSSEEALTDTNPWNTYVHTGLPIGPISSPGDAAIDAAMHPADGPWLFFVTVNLATGETVFSETVEEHDAATQQLREWCEANPGQGC